MDQLDLEKKGRAASSGALTYNKRYPPLEKGGKKRERLLKANEVRTFKISSIGKEAKESLGRKKKGHSRGK